MATTPQAPKPRGSYLDQPLYWFGIWDIARERCNQDLAERAKSELLRLGVVVTEYRSRMDTEAVRCSR